MSRGVAHLHSQKIVHRDLKSQNLLLFDQVNGFVKNVNPFHVLLQYSISVLGTCTTFSATAPPRHWRELKKVAHVAVALKQKIMAQWQWHENKMALICAISVPFSNQI